MQGVQRRLDKWRAVDRNNVQIGRAFTHPIEAARARYDYILRTEAGESCKRFDSDALEGNYGFCASHREPTRSRGAAQSDDGDIEAQNASESEGQGQVDDAIVEGAVGDTIRQCEAEDTGTDRMMQSRESQYVQSKEMSAARAAEARWLEARMTAHWDVDWVEGMVITSALKPEACHAISAQ